MCYSMGGLPIPSEKDRQKIVQNRKRYEQNLAARQRLHHSTPPAGALNAPQNELPESASTDFTSTPSVIEVKVVRSSPGVLVVEYVHPSRTYMGVLLAENGANGAPGIISEDMARFRETLRAHTNVPVIDQWTSVVGERFATSGFRFRNRCYMRTNGRMICAGCMRPVPENTPITRRHFVNVKQRKLQVAPKDNKRVVAQLPPSERQMVDDEVGYESVDEHFSSETADYSSDASASSLSLQKRNKRKAYVPRGAYSVLVPAGVDLFEPEYDPLPGPSSGTAKGLCNVRPSHKLAKKFRSLLASRNRQARVGLAKNEPYRELNSDCGSNTEIAKTKERESDIGRRTFKSDKIRRAFSPLYSIKKTENDSLHMTFVRQPNTASKDAVQAGTATAVVREGAPLHVARSSFSSLPAKRPAPQSMPPFFPETAVEEKRIADSTKPSVPTVEHVAKIPDELNEFPTCHPSQPQNSQIPIQTNYSLTLTNAATDSISTATNLDMGQRNMTLSEKCTLDSSKAEIERNTIVGHGDPNRPPIRLVLKSVKKSEMGIHNASTTKAPSQTCVRAVAGRHRPAAVKVLSKAGPTVPQRRSDAGCPPMCKANSENTEKHFDGEGDRSKMKLTKNYMRPTQSFLRSLGGRKSQGKCQAPPNPKKTDNAADSATASIDNNCSFKIGEVVWAKNGTDPYWPGQIYKFVKENAKYGAAVVWFGVDTYSPFIELTRIEKFAEFYNKRFNPKRVDRKYHKAVGDAIRTCFPQKGYFEQKMSPQVYKALSQSQSINLGNVNIISRRRRRVASSNAVIKKRKIPSNGQQTNVLSEHHSKVMDYISDDDNGMIQRESSSSNMNRTYVVCKTDGPSSSGIATTVPSVLKVDSGTDAKKPNYADTAMSATPSANDLITRDFDNI